MTDGNREGTAADTMPDGWQRWLDWQQSIAPENAAEIAALEVDRGRYLGYVRVTGRRAHVHLDPPIVSVPPSYARQPLRRDVE